MEKSMGTEIARLRKAGGMTQAELAEKMSVTDKAVSKWERGLSCPDISSVPHLAEILGVSVEELMNCEAQKSEKKNFNELFILILKGVALAMGVATAVLSVLGQIETKSALTMLSLGLAALAICALEEKEKKG